jgi:hypothetical protein
MKVANYCDPSSTGTLTCVKSLVSMFRFAIVDCFLLFW